MLKLQNTWKNEKRLLMLLKVSRRKLVPVKLFLRRYWIIEKFLTQIFYGILFKEHVILDFQQKLMQLLIVFQINAFRD